MGSVHDPPKILLLGATGYIGGTVLDALVASRDPFLAAVPRFTVLLRSHRSRATDRTADWVVDDEEDHRARRLSAAYGGRVACVPFAGLDDAEVVRAVAAEHDVVVNVGTGFHPGGTEALVHGLVKRRETHPDSPAWLLHLSGCTNIADRPFSGTPYPDREWDDADSEAIFTFEQAENARHWYPQRAAELAALGTAAGTGVNALSLLAPLVFGTGGGLFNRAGIMVPTVMNYVLARGHGFSLGYPAMGVIDRVHVADLADLYLLCLGRILAGRGAELPNGRAGIMLVENGRLDMNEISHACLDVAFAAGVLPRADGGPREKEVRTVTLAEAAELTAGNLEVAEAGWGGNKRMRGTLSRRLLGWTPTRGEAAWRRDLQDELQACLRGLRGVTIDGCIAERDAPGT
ncbi:NAD dependent epimerase/dehydratase [Xylariaceae sp. FL0804]|nr:NAD dependent epimerase/dehydratase [Xylariaceae sp. FL0804]